MTALILGLVIFLGAHSVRIFGEGWRSSTRQRIGENAYKGVYTLASLAGFALLVWGFGQARQQPVLLWTPMVWTRHVAALLMLVSFVLLAAAYVPGNGIKARTKDPMILGVKTWALAHLIANGTLADVVLFGSFLAWAVLDFRAARQRRKAGREPAPSTPASGARTAVTVVAGVVAWAAFAFWLHGLLIGVRPF